MNIKFINQYTAEDMKNATVKAELAEVFKVDDTFDWTGSYGLDLHNCILRPPAAVGAAATAARRCQRQPVFSCNFSKSGRWCVCQRPLGGVNVRPQSRVWNWLAI